MSGEHRSIQNERLLSIIHKTAGLVTSGLSFPWKEYTTLDSQPCLLKPKAQGSVFKHAL